MPLKHLSVFLLILALFAASTVRAQEKKRIDYKSNILYTTAELGPDIKILTDSVAFFHEGSEMYCDSAQFNPSKNAFRAYGRIEIIKPGEKDTVFLYGDSLRYSGITKIAVMRSNVVLIQDSLTLLTDSLDYNLNTNIAYYPNHGTTFTGKDTLRSVFGYYYADDRELFFKDSVVVQNPRFTLKCDTLKHDTKTQISYFYGPTEIFSDSNYIYCERGLYDHDKDLGRISKNAFLQNKEKTMYGDSLFYNRKLAFGEAFRNVTIRDTLKEMLLLGNYGRYDELKDIALMTDRALFIQVSEGQDSLFLHADTLTAYNDTLKYKELDDKGVEVERDSVYRIIKAYRHVKIFRADYQSKCDSLNYNFKDSIMEMFYKPVVWSEENQLTAEKIVAYTLNGAISQVDLIENAFVISQSDSIRFDQVNGKKIIGYIDDQELYRIDVLEDGKSIYFPRDAAQKLIGVNKVECINMVIYLENQKMDKIWFYSKPKGTMYPPLTLDAESMKLPGFNWLDNIRPKKKEDVFIWDENVDTDPKKQNRVPQK